MVRIVVVVMEAGLIVMVLRWLKFGWIKSYENVGGECNCVHGSSEGWGGDNASSGGCGSSGDLG